MTVLHSKISDQNKQKVLFDEYPWIYSNVYLNIQNTINDFFNKDFYLRFISLSQGENLLFYGDEYFVNKIPVTKISDIKIRISSSAISSILDNALGVSPNKFDLKNLTNLEANLIKSFTVAIYKNIENYLNKTEINKKVIESAKEYNLTFYLRTNNEHSGKIIVSIPDYMIKDNIQKTETTEQFSVSDFENIKINMRICAGKSKITLNDIKGIEEGDIILLENSNINEMSVYWEGKQVPFRINPNPSLIISIDNNGGNHMGNETSSKSQNMWDSILVDIVAEFDNVKLTLGELKQISDGLVIDVGSVYENKIKLRVENQIVATGELVILNDRYGVRITEVIKNQNGNAGNSTENNTPTTNAQKKIETNQANDNENFDYSDFDIEDESI